MNADEGEARADLEREARRRRRDMERLIRWYFGPGEARMALWVAWRVSSMQPLAFGRFRANAVGLFQLLPEDCGLDPAEAWVLHNPIRNVAAAHRIHAKQGWGYWGVEPPPHAFEEPE